MALVFHGRDLGPFVLANVVLLDGAKPLFAGEASKDVDSTLANGDGVRIPGLGHLGLVQDLVLLRHVDPSVFLGRRATTGDKDLGGR